MSQRVRRSQDLPVRERCFGWQAKCQRSRTGTRPEQIWTIGTDKCMCGGTIHTKQHVLGGGGGAFDCV